jgi:hypothetical protein
VARLALVPRRQDGPHGPREKSELAAPRDVPEPRLPQQLVVARRIGILRDLLLRQADRPLVEANGRVREILEERRFPADDERACREGALGLDHLHEGVRGRLRGLRGSGGDDRRHPDCQRHA